VNPDLQQFVREALARGVPRAVVREKLIAAGWPSDEADAALASWADSEFGIPVPRRRPYLSAREAFLYLVMFVTLYISAFNVGVLLFQFIERWLPDTLGARHASGTYSPEHVRNAAAAILISYPIFLLLSRLIGRAVAREPEERSSRIRKWLTYLTLFVAAVVIIGDLTFLVSRLLSGELAPRFLLKVLVVLAIAGTAFGHYLGDLRREEDRAMDSKPRPTSPLARLAGIGITATLAVGLWHAGSPQQERRRQFDVERVNHLRAISRTIETWYRERGALPDSLGAVLQLPQEPIGSVSDPRTGVPYEYRALDSTSYRLCAIFDAADTMEAAPRSWDRSFGSRFWRHGAGRHCFTFRIPKHASPEP
jgi:hypothetical protein